MSFWAGKRILVTGGAGFLGSHVVDFLTDRRGVSRDAIVVPRSAHHDLRRLEDCLRVVGGVDVVIHLAARVGGIAFNLENLASQLYNVATMNLNVAEAARLESIEKFVSVCCVCAYPRDVEYPLREDAIHLGRPEDTHEGYGVAKRLQITQAMLYRRQYGMNMVVVVPVNCYGPRDNFDRATAHVIPALIRKCLEDEELLIWGDGTPRRDFLYVEDAAEGIVLAAERLDSSDPVNVGSGREITIREIVAEVTEATHFRGRIVWDKTKPNGQPRRVVSIERAKALLGFEPRHSLREGLRKTVDWFKSTHIAAVR